MLSAELIPSFGRKKSKQTQPEEVDTHSDDDAAGAAVSPPTSAARKTNRQGLVTLSNGVVAMRDLDLAARVPTKTRDDDAAKMFNAKLTLSKAFTLFTLMVHGPRMPVEKARDDTHRRILLHSAAPYALSQETLETILGADRDELIAYTIGLAKNAQQVLKYTLGGMVGNVLNEQVFTPRNVYPTDVIKVHLGLTGDHARMSVMNL